MNPVEQAALRAGKSPRLPLEGVRVTGFSWVWAGPAFGQLMADMGAEVFKIETNKHVDHCRTTGACLKDVPGNTFISHNTHRNQLSVSLDLTTREGQEIAKDMVRQSDVVIENFSTGLIERYGLGYETLRKVRPDIIMVSLSGAGRTGPLKDVMAYGSNIASLSGFDSFSGYPDGSLMPCGTTFTDAFAGFFGALAALAALRYRLLTGKGQFVDISQWEMTSAMLGGPLLDYAMNGRIQGPVGNRNPMAAPQGVYRTQGDDRWVAITVKSQEEWLAFCKASGHKAWAADPRFADHFLRDEHHDELDALISQWTQGLTNTEVTQRLQKAGVAAIPSFSLPELYNDPHFKARDSWVKVQHVLGEEVIFGMPWKLSKTPARIRRACPPVGYDSVYGFREFLGIPEDRFKALEEQKVIY